MLKSNGVLSNDMINGNGNIVFNSLLVIRIGNNYNPNIGDTLKLFLFATSSWGATINVIGAPYRNGKFLPDGSVEIIVSDGSATNTGYKCHYLGNRKILEINNFANQNQVLMALTAPLYSSAWIGFGFHTNSSVSNAYLFIASQNSVFQTFGHNQSLSSTFQGIIDAEASHGTTFFQLGDLYHTFTVLVSNNILLS
jgi:hypothetical protein